jgi:hypothetical protein
VSPLLLRAVGAGEVGSGAAVGDEATFVLAGRVGVWVSRFDARPELGRAEMLEHHRLVEAICAAGACLPVRLGSWVESEEEARRLLAAREEALLAALARVAGRVEVAVSCLWRGVPRFSSTPHPDPLPEGEGARVQQGTPIGPPAPAALNPSGGAGARYLARRRSEIARRDARAARARELARAVERAVGVAGAEAQHRLCPSEAVALSSALLVGRDEAEAAVAAVRALAGRLADVGVVVNGPWPPYSFAGIG